MLLNSIVSTPFSSPINLKSPHTRQLTSITSATANLSVSISDNDLESRGFNLRHTIDGLNLDQLNNVFVAVGFPRRDTDKIRIALEHTDTLLWLEYEKTKKPVAFARATGDGVFNAIIWDVVVDPSFQGLGLGKAVMERLVAELLRKGITNIALYSEPQVLGFYRPLGFVSDPDGIRGMESDLSLTASWGGNYWSVGFLSRNKEEDYGNLVEEIKSIANEKGIRIITDGDFHPHIFDRVDGINRVLSLYHISIVFLSIGYVKCRTCMNELLLMDKSGRTPLVIHRYTDEELRESGEILRERGEKLRKSVIDRFDKFLDLAYSSTDPDDHPAVRRMFVSYFLRFTPYLTPSIAANKLLSSIVSRVNKYQLFPDYQNFEELDGLASTCLELIKQPTDHINVKYLVVSSTESNYDKIFLKGLLSQVERLGFYDDVKSLDFSIEFPSVRRQRQDWPTESSLSWVILAVQWLLGLSDDNKDLLYTHYQSLIDNLPNKKYILVISNVPTYYHINVLASVLDFVCSGSLVIFTSTDRDICSARNSWYEMSHGNQVLYIARGKLSNPNDLQTLKTFPSYQSEECDESERHR